MVSRSLIMPATPSLPPGMQIKSRGGQFAKVCVGTRPSPQSLGTGAVDFATMWVTDCGSRDSTCRAKLLNNGNDGILYLPANNSTASAKFVIDHVAANGNNAAGIDFFTSVAAGASATGTISNSVTSENTGDGIVLRGATQISIDNVTIGGNHANGIEAFGTVHVLLGRSVIATNNAVGIQNNTSPNTFFTYQDNRINLNGGGDIAGPMNTTFAQQ